MERRHSCPTVTLSHGGRCAERDSSGAGGDQRTLRVTGTAGGLLAPVREDDLEGRGGPFHICNGVGDTGVKAFGDMGHTA